MPKTISDHASDYTQSLRTAGHPSRRINTTAAQLDYFINWANRIDITTLDDFDTNTGACYYDHLAEEPDLNTGTPIGPRICRERITKLRRLLAYLNATGVTDNDLSQSIPIVEQHGKWKPTHACTTATLSP